MIRLYQETDQEELYKILTEPDGHYMSEDKVDFEGFQEVFVYEQCDEIMGFVALEVDPKISQIACYVRPSCRRNGIGTRLFNHGKMQLSALDPNTIWLFFRNDVGSSAQFYQNKGALPWYSYHYMENDNCRDESYETQGFDTVIPYQVLYFEDYLNIRAESFLDLNREIDSRPFDERDRRPEIERWTLKHKDKIWLFMKDEKIVGSIALFNGFFDEVFVAKYQQKNGIGSAIVRWALNMCSTEKWKPSLCVVTNNIAAIQLYKSNGFVIKQTLELNRMFSKSKEPDLRGPIGG